MKGGGGITYFSHPALPAAASPTGPTHRHACHAPRYVKAIPGSKETADLLKCRLTDLLSDGEVIGAINAARGRDNTHAPKLVVELERYWNLSHTDVPNRIQQLQALKRPINVLFDLVWPSKVKDWVQLLKVRPLPEVNPWAKAVLQHSGACTKSPRAVLSVCSKLSEGSNWKLSPTELKKLVDKELDSIFPTSAKGWLIQQQLGRPERLRGPAG